MQIYLTLINNNIPPKQEIWDKLKSALPTEKFNSIINRQMSILAYAMLFEVLEKFHNINDVQLAFEQNGKPYLGNYPNIYISLSHSQSYIALAVDTTACGIDIEQHRAINSRIYRRVLSRNEIDWVRQGVDIGEQSRRFFKLWTMKEALLKSTGEGISLKLNELSLIKDNNPITSYNNGKFVSFENDNYILTAYGNSNEIKIHSL